MVPVPFSRLAPPRGTQWLGGWLEGLEFGLDFGFGEAHGLEESDVVVSYALGVGVIEAQAFQKIAKPRAISGSASASRLVACSSCARLLRSMTTLG
jgi:hypothetical protein